MGMCSSKTKGDQPPSSAGTTGAKTSTPVTAPQGLFKTLTSVGVSRAPAAGRVPQAALPATPLHCQHGARAALKLLPSFK